MVKKKNTDLEKKILHENKKNEDLIDTSVIDDSLKEINSTLKILEEKIEAQQDKTNDTEIFPEIKFVSSKIKIAKNKSINEENNSIKKYDLVTRIQHLERKMNDIEVSLLNKEFKQEEILYEKGAIKINEDNLSISEFLNAEENIKEKKKSFFGLFSYLILIFLFIFIFYVFLIYFRNLIIFNFPNTEKYIVHFFEVMKIIKITIFEFINYFNR